jgi:GntR family transcriptional regulator
MSPRLDRPPPPYLQITNHFREAIIDGRLEAGSRLPSIVDIARDFSVATATAAKAITQLQVEGLVYTSPQGTFVAGDKAASTAQDRLRRVRTRGRPETPFESVRVTAAELVRPPRYVNDLLGIEGEVVRREWVTTSHGRPSMLSVAWFPPAFVDAVPELLSTDPATVGTLTQAVERATGRQLVHARDYYEAREADEREAGHLGLAVGSPILAGTYIWSDRDGDIIEYGEFVIPPKRVISYEYEYESTPD